MAHKIRVLSESLANKIAAGEVVERPASVVKELVENSVDAGATEITIDIKRGGKGSVKVIDNGEGMDRDDALLAFERHSTSKISQDEDLFRISTLGFRGEAIPSIASVSKMRIRTKPVNALAGTHIYSEGGKIREVNDAGCAIGTSIEVNNLFYNTPARLKFLKTDTTEIGHIVDVVTQIALVNQDIHFKLNHNGKVITNTTITNRLLNRVVEVLGRDVHKSLYQLLLQEEYITIKGLISEPELTRSTGRAIYTYVNRRFIRDRVVNHAIMEAYRTFIMKNRYPVAILFIDIPVSWVDVNVHPTKREVRFKEQHKVHDLIVKALHATLERSPWVKEINTTPGEVSYSAPEVYGNGHNIGEGLAGYSVSHKNESPSARITTSQRDINPPVQMELIEEDTPFFSSLIPIGQVKNTYILCSNNEGLILIDQHAAHERVIFEMLKDGHQSSGIASQGLLIPQHIELRYGEARLLEGYLGELSKVGMEIEPFGGDTFAVKSVPHYLVDKDYRQLIMDIIDELRLYGKSLKIEESMHKILILMACHGAIKANQRLPNDEIKALFHQLDSVGSPTNCPHGRPILRKITYQEIDKMFKRI